MASLWADYWSSHSWHIERDSLEKKKSTEGWQLKLQKHDVRSVELTANSMWGKKAKENGKKGLQQIQIWHLTQSTIRCYCTVQLDRRYILKYLNQHIDHSGQRLSNGTFPKIHEINITCQPHVYTKTKNFLMSSFVFCVFDCYIINHTKKSPAWDNRCDTCSIQVLQGATTPIPCTYQHFQSSSGHLSAWAIQTCSKNEAFSNIVLRGRERKEFYSEYTRYQIY